jgi:NADH-quinone oxidoreductase subunit J
MIETFLFYFFSALTLAGGILMITRKNAVISGVWLISSLLGVAGLFLLQGAEFVFVAQLILYIGGVVLLFLFAMMLIDLQSSVTIRRFRRGWPFILIVGVGLAVELVSFLCRGKLPARTSTSAGPMPEGNTELLASALFSNYLVAFELASVLLMVAIVGAVVLGKPGEDHRS